MDLPSDIAGSLLISQMPGSEGNDFGDWQAAVEREKVSMLVNLSETAETVSYSPEYHEYLVSDQFPGDYYHLPISDFSTPQNISVFGDVVRSCVDHVERGHIVVAHCRAGIGRSGLFAISVLAMIGLPDQDAIDAVRAAGGQFETAKQQKFLLTFRKTLDS